MSTETWGLWRVRAALAVAGLAWGATGMAVLVGLNVAWAESMRRLGVSTASLAPLGRIAGAGWGMGEAVVTWLLRAGLDGVVAFARTHPGLASVLGPVPFGGLALGPGVLVIAVVVTAVALQLLARR